MMMDKRFRFKFSKIGVYKYLSHLDIIGIMIRALRRAGIRVKYTEGFNPKPKITFGPPIPLGFESAAEYADVTLSDDITPEDFLSGMNRELEGRIVLSGAAEIPPGVKNLMSQVDIAEYRIEILAGDADTETVLKYAGKASAVSEAGDSIQDMYISKNGSGNSSCTLVLYGYAKTSKDRNDRVFKLRGFLEAFKEVLEDEGMKIKSVLKTELFILKDDAKLTPFEVL